MTAIVPSRISERFHKLIWQILFMYKGLPVTHDTWEAIAGQFEQRLNIPNLLATWMEETLLLNCQQTLTV